MIKFVRLFILVCFVLSFAHAGEKDSHGIFLELTAEEWVKVEKPRLAIAIDIAGKEEDVARMRGGVLETLKKISQEEWFITHYSVFQDSSGLIRLTLVAESRVLEKDIYGLHEKAKALSKPGYSVRVSFLDYSPSVQDMEKAMLRARQSIYRMAFEESKRATSELGQNYRVASIEFLSSTVQKKEVDFLRTKKHEELQARVIEDYSIPKSDRVIVRARVVLQRE